MLIMNSSCLYPHSNVNLQTIRRKLSALKAHTLTLPMNISTKHSSTLKRSTISKGWNLPRDRFTIWLKKVTSTKLNFPRSKLLSKNSESSTNHIVKKSGRRINVTFFVSKERRSPLWVRSSTPKAKLNSSKERKTDCRKTSKAKNDLKNH